MSRSNRQAGRQAGRRAGGQAGGRAGRQALTCAQRRKEAAPSSLRGPAETAAQSRVLLERAARARQVQAAAALHSNRSGAPRMSAAASAHA